MSSACWNCNRVSSIHHGPGAAYQQRRDTHQGASPLPARPQQVVLRGQGLHLEGMSVGVQDRSGRSVVPDGVGGHMRTILQFPGDLDLELYPTGFIGHALAILTPELRRQFAAYANAEKLPAEHLTRTDVALALL